MNNSEHTYHIPVLGLGFSVDMPLKTAQYGLSSVMSIVNDNLIEKMREFYSKIWHLPYEPILTSHDDARAARITEYLNMIQVIVAKQIENLKIAVEHNTGEVVKFFNLLPEASTLKKNFLDFIAATTDNVKKELLTTIRAGIVAGEICVNIMTKIDKDNYRNGEKLDREYSDALAGLRGFAQSKGPASIVFSAGFNRRLFSYLENFDCFYPDKNGIMEKKIILKISDYRSAFTQAKFLASKGIWISEFRVESGLNCSGHAFPIDGRTAGMVMEELNQTRFELSDTLFAIYKKAVMDKKGIELTQAPPVKYTYQGGVATHEEHEFLLKKFNLDSIGWGAAFMFVPEATNLHSVTLDKLKNVDYNDLYISETSPLGVPFNTLRENINEEKAYKQYLKGDYGNSCVHGYLKSNTEFTEKPICTASKQYMDKKIQAIKEQGLTGEALEKALKPVLVKYCLCCDLSKTHISPCVVEKDDDGYDVKSVCVGKTAAYFNETMSLEEITDHIYGRANHLDGSKKRPSLFITELNITMDFLKSLISNGAAEKEITTYIDNLRAGIQYYSERSKEFAVGMTHDDFLTALNSISQELDMLRT